MKNIIIILFISFITLILYARKQEVVVLDKDSQLPVDYAIITFSSKGENRGIYADSYGRASIDLNMEVDSIVFSCVGYYSSIFFSTLDIPDTVKLTKHFYQIEEIIITPTKIQLKNIGNINKRTVSNLTASSGFECATFITNDINREVLINSALLKIRKKKTDLISVIRLHLYSIDDRGKPENDLISENIIVYLTPNDKNVIEVNLSPCYI